MKSIETLLAQAGIRLNEELELGTKPLYLSAAIFTPIILAASYLYFNGAGIIYSIFK